jgi:hypothetical protein
MVWDDFFQDAPCCWPDLTPLQQWIPSMAISFSSSSPPIIPAFTDVEGTIAKGF